MALRDFRDLLVWQRAMDLLVEVYAVTRVFPTEERFGLAAHCRRSADSIPSNIAEGYSRRHRAEYNRHLDIAYASTAELHTQLLAAQRLGMLGPTCRALTLLLEVERMLSSLRRRLRESSPS